MDDALYLSLLDSYQHFDQALSCPVCLCPKFRMVYGACQHKVCSDCLYDENNTRHSALDRCPVCLKDDVFPPKMPDIPKDNEMVMYLAGVRACSVQSCQEQFWHWEIDSHMKRHLTKSKTPEERMPLKDFTINISQMNNRKSYTKTDLKKERKKEIKELRFKLRSRTVYAEVIS